MDIKSLINCALELTTILEIATPPQIEIEQQINKILNRRHLIECAQKYIISQQEAAEVLLADLQIWLLSCAGKSILDMPEIDCEDLIDLAHQGLFSHI